MIIDFKSSTDCLQNCTRRCLLTNFETRMRPSKSTNRNCSKFATVNIQPPWPAHEKVTAETTLGLFGRGCTTHTNYTSRMLWKFKLPSVIRANLHMFHKAIRATLCKLDETTQLTTEILCSRLCSF